MTEHIAEIKSKREANIVAVFITLNLLDPESVCEQEASWLSLSL
jgi:hypothetical protein